jgi:hypothetical protein
MVYFEAVPLPLFSKSANSFSLPRNDATNGTRIDELVISDHLAPAAYNKGSLLPCKASETTTAAIRH